MQTPRLRSAQRTAIACVLRFHVLSRRIRTWNNGATTVSEGEPSTRREAALAAELKTASSEPQIMSCSKGILRMFSNEIVYRRGGWAL